MVEIAKLAEYVQQREPNAAKMKLQKLCFYSQVWSIVWTGHPITEDDFDAWELGPVSPKLWIEEPVSPSASELTDEQKAIVDAVLDFYGHMSGTLLSEFTHREQAWGKAYEKGRNTRITPELIAREYTKHSMSSGAQVPKRPLSTVGQSRSVREGLDSQLELWAETLKKLA